MTGQGNYSRDELISICEQAIVPESLWHNRDSAEAQKQVGQAWAWLRAGCDYELSESPVSNERTIWLVIHARGFDYFDTGGGKDAELVYLPTPARLAKRYGKDWY